MHQNCEAIFKNLPLQISVSYGIIASLGGDVLKDFSRRFISGFAYGLGGTLALVCVGLVLNFLGVALGV